MISSLSRFDYEQWSECNLEFQKLQIYQRFAGSRQEGFILKIQNDENNAAQQDKGKIVLYEISRRYLLSSPF